MPEEPEVKQEEHPKPDTHMVVVGRHGEKKEIIKGADGKFVRKERKMIPTRDVTAEIRKFISSIDKGSLDGRMNREQKIRLNNMLQSMYDIATGKSEIDVKARQAAVQAFEALMLRGHGKPALNDEEQDALKRAGIRTVFIAIPKDVEEPEEDKTEKPRLPSFASSDPPFIDAEVVSENKKE